MGCDVVKVAECSVKGQCRVGGVGIDLGAEVGGQVGVRWGGVDFGVNCCARLVDVIGGLRMQVLFVCVMSEVA